MDPLTVALIILVGLGVLCAIIGSKDMRDQARHRAIEQEAFEHERSRQGTELRAIRDHRS